MPSNLAARRAAKAIRRKVVVAEKRKTDMQGSTLPERVRHAAQAPIRHCVMLGGLFETGISTLLLVRGHTAGSVTVAAFLIDAYCLGIKDVLFRPMSGDEYTTYSQAIGAQLPLVPIDPADARKLMRELAAWAGSLGFPPHRDFKTVEQMFGDVDADSSAAQYNFGREGKPFYMPGPSESPALVRQRMQHLMRRLGTAEFDYMVPA